VSAGRFRVPGPRARRRAVAVAAVLLALLALGAVASAEVVQRGDLRVTFEGSLTPTKLPRSGTAPIHVSMATKIASTNGKTPAQLRKISISINKFGQLDTTGLPVCELDQIQPATTGDALAACRRSLIGGGQFSAKVLLTGQAPFPSAGKIYAFYGEVEGRKAILAHVYGTDPAPTSFTLPFVIRSTKGTYGTVFEASLPRYTSSAGYVTGLSLDLGKTWSTGGKAHSFISASCPAPKGFPGATFPFAKAALAFKGRSLGVTLTRNCRVRG
jgi:hypothetical protein